MSFSVTYDDKGFQKAIKKVPDLLTKELDNELRTSMSKVRADARRNHRFKYISGSLERSTKLEVKKRVGVVYLEKGIADYGKYVHDGHGSWLPDTFVFNAFKKHKNEIINGMNKVVKNVLKKAGF